MKSCLRLLTLVTAGLTAGLLPALHAVTQVHVSYTVGENKTDEIILNPSETTILYPPGGSATQSGSITGTGTLWKQNWGDLTLTGDNTYYGDTTIMTGSFILGGDNVIPFNAGKTLSVDGGTLALGSHSLSVDKFYFGSGAITATSAHIDVTTSFKFDGNVNFAPVVSLVFSGTASLTVDCNPGSILTFTGANTFTGGTTINHNGNLQIGNNGATGSIVGNVVNNGYLTISRSDNISFTGDISGSGTFYKRGDGILTLTGNNTYTGTTSISDGTLKLGSDLTTSGTYVVGGASTFDVDSHNARANVIYISNGTLTGTSGTITVANALQQVGGTATVAATIAGAGGITMSTSGTRLTLTRDNTFTGATNVSAGTLSVNGSTSASSLLTISGTGILGGSGTIGGATTIQSGGTLAPGNSPGLLTFNSDLTLNSGSTSAFQIDGTSRGTTYDAVDVAGLTTLAGTLALSFGSTVADGTTLDLFGGAGSLTGDFSSVTASGAYSGSFSNNNGYWTLESGGQTLGFYSGNGNLGVGVSAIPEPSTYALLAGLSVLGLAAVRRRAAAASRA